MEDFKVCVVTVTYGNRFKFLKQVIDACLREGIDKIIVIDNASYIESREKLKELEAKPKNKLKVLYLPENTGSAGGYKRGLEEAYKCEECEYIWLLDDDNMPQRNSLKVLKEFWNNLDEENKEEKVSLLSFRPDRQAYKEAIMTNNPNLVLGRKNSFLGFHILDLPKKIIRVIKRKLGLSTFKENPNIQSGKVAVAPYGGMFFHKKIIDKIGYPKEEFFVYADDHEWSYRITKDGGSIYFLVDSVVEDIDTSLGLVGGQRNIFFTLLNKSTDERIYYSTRNRVIFEKSIVNNHIVYKLNTIIFFLLLKLFVNKSNFNRSYLIKISFKDGKNNYFKKFDYAHDNLTKSVKYEA